MDQTRIRQFVDGELSPHDARALEEAIAHQPDLRLRVEFERALRDRVQRCFDEAAPQATVEAVRAVLESERKRAERRWSQTAPVAAAAVDSGNTDEPGGPVRRSPLRLLRGPAHANRWAVAACIAIVAGAVAFGLFGPQLPQQRNVPYAENLAMIGDTAADASGEHHKLRLGADALLDAITLTQPREIQLNYAPRLGRTVPVPDLTEIGMTFVGAHLCPLEPLPENTVHLMYVRTAHLGREGPRAMLSLCMQPDRGQFGRLDPSRVYRPRDFGTCTGEPASVWSDGELLYILIACDPADHEAAEHLIQQQVEFAMPGGR